MEEKEKKKNGCMKNFLFLAIIIFSVVYIVKMWPDPAKPEKTAKEQEEKTEKKDQTENQVPVREEKSAPEVIQAAADQNRINSMTDDDLKKESREKTEKTKKACCDLLFELLNFKDSQEFAYYGFGTGGPYNQWLKRAEEQRKEISSDFQKKVLSWELSTAPGNILQLGFEYRKTHGAESEYTKTVIPDLKKTIGYNSYLKKKSKNAKKKKEVKKTESAEEKQEVMPPSENDKGKAKLQDSRMDDEIDVWCLVQEHVERRLVSPKSASFPFGGAQRHVECTAPGIFIVRSYVDAKNAFGAEIRQNFFAKVVKYENGKFEVIQLTFETPF